jgi:hypothetical protein
MHRLGRALMGLGLGVGIAVGLAISAHMGFDYMPWLVNVALAKLGLIASAGLIASGAIASRVARVRAARQLHVSSSEPAALPPPPAQ